VGGQKDFFAAWCIAMSAGSFVGGVMFNTLGLGSDLRLAGIGGTLVVVF